MNQVIPGLSSDAYQPHALHAATRDWPETNCFVDLWIEVLHARGLDPVPALGVCARMDFEGDQFTFFKIPAEDLSTLYGIELHELSIFDRVEEHAAEQVRRGRMPLIEVDAFHLPDTRGVSYGLEHSKTTIGINAIDVGARRIDYFHNAGFFSLAGDDYAGVFQHARLPGVGSPYLFPYTEFLKFDAPPLTGDLLGRAAARLLTGHVRKMPQDNPVRAFARRIEAHAQAMTDRDPAYFHKYAFNTLRQIGSNFELLGDFLRWLDDRRVLNTSDGARHCAELSTQMKAFQFQLARAVTRRRTDGLASLLEPSMVSWDAIAVALRSACL